MAVFSFQAEKIIVSQTRDNSFVFKIECGEYVREQASELIKIEPESKITVTVEVEE
jgi:hypothetical protein